MRTPGVLARVRLEAEVPELGLGRPASPADTQLELNPGPCSQASVPVRAVHQPRRGAPVLLDPGLALPEVAQQDLVEGVL